MPGTLAVQQAVTLAEAGKKDAARSLIQQILDQDPDDAYAWAVMAQLAEDQEQALQAVQHVLRLKPGSAWAQQFLARLNQDDESDDDPIPLWLIGSLAGLVGLLLLAVLVFAGPGRRDRLA